VEPADLASEMIRLVDDAKANLRPDEVSTSGGRLFYTCGEGESVAIRVSPQHPLANTFFYAYTHEADDPDARRVLVAYHRMETELKAWALVHPDADTIRLDTKLSQLAVELQLSKLLTSYSAAP